MKYLLHIMITLCLLLAGCGHNSEIDRQMDAAEGLMLSAPDSSLLILDSIHVGDLSGKEQKARYALLKSMALDKNYIDTTTFDVLQPAIDYYLDHGTPDEKLRTYYYEGRIHQNAGRNEKAMRSFLEGIDLGDEITDSLTLANLLVAQSSLFYSSYMMEDVYSNALKSADIYSALGKEDKSFGSLLTALHASVLLKNKQEADSIFSIVKLLATEHPEFSDDFLIGQSGYILRYGDLDSQRDLLMTHADDSTLSRDLQLDYAMGCLAINEPILSMSYYNSVDTVGMNINGLLKYLIIGAQVYKSNGDYKQAFEYIWNYQVQNDNKVLSTFDTKSRVIQEKHNQEKQTFERLHQRDSWIIVGLITIIFLLATFLTTAYKLRMSKNKRQNAELECERQTLLADNLKLRIGQLEDETETLQQLIKNQESSQSPALSSIIQERIEMLNGIIPQKYLTTRHILNPIRNGLKKKHPIGKGS